MNRIIKFRAWDSVIKKMYPADELGRDELQIHPDGKGFFNASCVSPRLSEYYPHLIPMQYTGLKDKNGVEIYDGDVVKALHSYELYDDDSYIERVSEHSGVVVFEHGKWHVKGQVLGLYQWDIKTLEVIGNIYENPEPPKE